MKEQITAKEAIKKEKIVHDPYPVDPIENCPACKSHYTNLQLMLDQPENPPPTKYPELQWRPRAAAIMCKCGYRGPVVILLRDSHRIEAYRFARVKWNDHVKDMNRQIKEAKEKAKETNKDAIPNENETTEEVLNPSPVES